MCAEHAFVYGGDIWNSDKSGNEYKSSMHDHNLGWNVKPSYKKKMITMIKPKTFCSDASISRNENK